MDTTSVIRTIDNVDRTLFQLQQLCVLLDTLAFAMPDEEAGEITWEVLGGVFGLIGDQIEAVREDLDEAMDTTERKHAEPNRWTAPTPLRRTARQKRTAS